MQAHLSLALKAQAQCRATIEALGDQELASSWCVREAG
jgi:hypothetical protein